MRSQESLGQPHFKINASLRSQPSEAQKLCFNATVWHWDGKENTCHYFQIYMVCSGKNIHCTKMELDRL